MQNRDLTEMRERVWKKCGNRCGINSGKASDLDTAARQSAQGMSSKGSDLDSRARNERKMRGGHRRPHKGGAPSAPTPPLCTHFSLLRARLSRSEPLLDVPWALCRAAVSRSEAFPAFFLHFSR